jgi:hypothetical protein
MTLPAHLARPGYAVDDAEPFGRDHSCQRRGRPYGADMSGKGGRRYGFETLQKTSSGEAAPADWREPSPFDFGMITERLER